MSMKVIPMDCPISIAVIDPKKVYGEEGQYTQYKGTLTELQKYADEAIAKLMEVRWYYKQLSTRDDEAIASQVIITMIPPGHVQPFHTHYMLHEMTLVEEGQIVAVDSETLTEKDSVSDLVAAGVHIKVNQMVIEGPGTRHTICNNGSSYARLVTIQTARIGIEEFPQDWSRDKSPA